MMQATTDSLLRRASLFLEDSEWGKAEQYADNVLDCDPLCARAYLIKLLSHMKVRSLEELAETAVDFSGDPDCQKILRFGTEQEKQQIEDCLERCSQKARLEEQEKQEQEEKAAVQKRERKQQRAKQAKKYALLITAAAAICIVFFVWIVPMINYNQAVSLRNQGKWEEAKQLFNSLDRRDETIETEYLQCMSLIRTGDYKGAMDLIYPGTKGEVFQRLIQESAEFKKYWFSSKGCLVTFGHYDIYTYHEPNRSDGIDWIVLWSDGDSSILISQEVLDYQPYDIANTYHDVPWSKSSLRDWLNRDFYDSTFSGIEKNAIIPTRISEYKNSSAPVTVHHDPVEGDKVYILSEREAELYFAKTDDVFADATQYAEKLGLKTSFAFYKTRVSWWPYTHSNGPVSTASWWLRTRKDWNGFFSQLICGKKDVLIKGFSSDFLYSFSDVQCNGVRPVICIDLNSDYFR